MLRRSCLASFLTVVIVFSAALAAAAPIKLARHPDYRAGKIVFSYLGDLWIANEDGTGAHRVSDHTARDIYPRFSPDGKWIAFSSNRYGNNDVFIIPAEGGAAKQLTFHSGNDEVVGWSRDGKSVVFRGEVRAATAEAASALAGALNMLVQMSAGNQDLADAGLAAAVSATAISSKDKTVSISGSMPASKLASVIGRLMGK